jgi:hypothetical protein
MGSGAVKRTEIETDFGVYLECEDERALGMESCGCDEPADRTLRPFRYGLIRGLTVSWSHPSGRVCVVAVRHDGKTDEWVPLTYEQWSLMKQEAADG